MDGASARDCRIDFCDLHDFLGLRPGAARYFHYPGRLCHGGAGANICGGGCEQAETHGENEALEQHRPRQRGMSL